MAKSDQPITIKKYANRRLYNTETSTYITLADLAHIIREGRNVEVVDAKTGDDLTRATLAQIILEEAGGKFTKLDGSSFSYLNSSSFNHEALSLATNDSIHSSLIKEINSVFF